MAPGAASDVLSCSWKERQNGGGIAIIFIAFLL